MKRLGDYIRQVDVRNRDLAVDNLLGLSISKQFIPSIANTIGTDMANYKVVQPRQFGYVPVTSRNGDKITVALYDGDKPCIISQAYIVFEVTDTDQLLPEYLMMWFRRPEFDRYARFKSHGSAREVFEWDEMCDVMLPVPSIEEQRKIVAEYQAVERRIENNRRLIASLESTAQTIYRKMFVDNIDPEDLPQGWRMGKMKDVATFAYGKMPKDKDNGVIPVFSGYGVVGYCNEAMYDKQHIVVIARGDSGSGKIVKSPKEFYLTNLAIAIKLNNESYRDYLYYHLLSLDTSTLRTGSAQAQVTINSIEEFDILIPTVDICADFYSVVDRIGAVKLELAQEEDILNNFSSLLLTKLSKL
ncbi:restriction endonuclease subunit S [Bacteroides acidifaciens]|uniref:restriction endonuclease subunit S n=1 Tax=Bacteroides acidifaciens TaxID=85831 RepID=UPI0025B37BB0|nr:restriction endonuclease subunit S [Bacteroides acidifaciens]